MIHFLVCDDMKEESEKKPLLLFSYYSRIRENWTRNLSSQEGEKLKEGFVILLCFFIIKFNKISLCK